MELTLEEQKLFNSVEQELQNSGKFLEILNWRLRQEIIELLNSNELFSFSHDLISKLCVRLSDENLTTIGFVRQEDLGEDPDKMRIQPNMEINVITPVIGDKYDNISFPAVAVERTNDLSKDDNGKNVQLSYLIYLNRIQIFEICRKYHRVANAY